MKKLLVLILALVMIMSLTACGGNNNDESSGENNDSKVQSFEITNENWDKYFEYVTTDLEMEDPDLATASTYLLLKEEFGTADAELSNVSVEMKYNPQMYIYKVDFTNKTYEQLRPNGELLPQMNPVLDMSEVHISKDEVRYGVLVWSLMFTEEPEDDTLVDMNRELTGISGTVTCSKSE